MGSFFNPKSAIQNPNSPGLENKTAAYPRGEAAGSLKRRICFGLFECRQLRLADTSDVNVAGVEKSKHGLL
jgi:hypothetical protein